MPPYRTITRNEEPWKLDVNAAVNIKVAGGHSETLNGRVGKRKTSVKEAASRVASIHQKYEQLSLL